MQDHSERPILNSGSTIDIADAILMDCLLVGSHPEMPLARIRPIVTVAISEQAPPPHTTAMLSFLEEVALTAEEYSLADLLERMYENQLALEAALMEVVLHSDKQGSSEVGDNIRGALFVIGENAGHIKQGLAKLKGSSVD